MITIKTPDEIERMRKSGALLRQVLDALREKIQPGVTTMELDRFAETMIRDLGAIPSCKGYEGFPYTLCTSVDDAVVHGFPNDTPLKEGSLLSIDTVLSYDGWMADSAFTAPVGEASAEIKRLIRVTEECFFLGASQARPGNRISDISRAVQKHAEANGYSVIRSYCGHGIGREMHEDPEVPNYLSAGGRGVRLKEGMVICVEPMISAGRWLTYVEDNGWVARTRDHSPCSHYEHTIAITENGPELMTWPGRIVE